jgi:hypothetical protein
VTIVELRLVAEAEMSEWIRSAMARSGPVIAAIRTSAGGRKTLWRRHHTRCEAVAAATMVAN